uniref:non-specific serine/threonine protein kinase n=1 Tax=Oryza barthii TaxID=65489 RepID=A0A0D3G586_9ORYZ
MHSCRSSTISGVVLHLAYWLVLVFSWQVAAAQAQQAPKTDPAEVAALNTILGRWGKKASSEWNISGEPCSGYAIDKTDWDYYPNINPFIKCDCTDSKNTVCHITKLRVTKLDVVGQIPTELQNLTHLVDLALAMNPLSGPLPKELGNLTNLVSLGISLDNFTGGLPEELGNLTKLRQLRKSDNGFIGKIPEYLGSMTNLQDIILRNCKISGDLRAIDFSKFENELSFNKITGQVPQSILNLGNLQFLFLGNNSLTGMLPDGISSSLKAIDFSYNQLSGSFPSWANQNNLQFALPSGLNCLQQDIPCLHYSFAIDCGSKTALRGSDNTIYEADSINLGAASYYVTDQTRWGVSSVGNYFQATDGNNIISSPQHFQNVVDSELFETARMSPSSLRYYGLGLENGNYTVVLQFAEFAFPDSQTWLSLGRRVFDIYVQGALKEKDFDIRNMAGGKSFGAVNRIYVATVSKNFLEIHLFWAGKGTSCIPTQGYYGPMISALSATPNFTPTVRNGVPKRKRKAGAIAGISIGVIVLALATIFGLFMLAKKRKTIAQQKDELYNLVGRPDVFSYAQLKLATENFSSQNILGEGGFGPVYKGKLPDGRVIAVKQLSQSSHQWTNQFVTEVATISAVQHWNLVTLHGCCIDSKTPLLVYEYLENGSLDRAIFGQNSFNLDWATRFEIILGIARGLTYLHEESSVRIVHRDIKASNILLDIDLTPKISDFGLAKLYDENQTHVSTGIAGTIGHLAPEYAMRGRLTEKADVFAFGVVMLETIAGRPNTDNSLEESKIYLFEWISLSMIFPSRKRQLIIVWGLYEKDQALRIVEPSLKDFDKDEVFRVICVALLCTQGSPHQRPPMSKVVAMLTGDVDVVKVVTKPSYITEWQLRGGGNCSYKGYTNPEFDRQKEITRDCLHGR